MTFLSHPLVTPNLVELREYQINLAEAALRMNTLVVLPTGLGKTAIALLVMINRLSAGKVVLVAPTKPLSEQHQQSFRMFLIDKISITLLTGELAPEKRQEAFNGSQVVIATPQTLENDLRSGLYDLSSVSLLIFDEAHHATGDYAYTHLAETYAPPSLQTDHLILALTASPGGKEEKVDEIRSKLFIEQTEVRSERSPDVIPYLHDKIIEVKKVELPETLRKASDILHDALKVRYQTLKELGYQFYGSPNARLLAHVLQDSKTKIQKGDGTGYAGVVTHAEIMKLKHAVICAESQGVMALKEYLHKMRMDAKDGSKASKNICSIPDVADLISSSYYWNQEIHPKIKELLIQVYLELDRNPDSRILVFASYRTTVSYLTDLLNNHDFPAHAFTGQSTNKKTGTLGMNQKKQVETINRFRRGDFKVLVSTSVGEEGLDIPNTDVVIFYESVPSEVRDIQRRGRTGRFNTGKVVKLVTKGTMDEKFHILAQKKEKEMRMAME